MAALVSMSVSHKEGGHGKVKIVPHLLWDRAFQYDMLYRWCDDILF